MQYAEKLRDPRWQRKRLEILERDEWMCVSCGAQDKTLTVHHAAYETQTEPWEYPNSWLRTFCEECHKQHHEMFGNVTNEFLRLAHLSGLGVNQFGRLNNILLHLSPMLPPEWDEVIEKLWVEVQKWERAENPNA